MSLLGDFTLIFACLGQRVFKGAVTYTIRLTPMKTAPPRQLEQWAVEAYRPEDRLLKLKGHLTTGGFLCTGVIQAHSDGVLQTKTNHRYTLGTPDAAVTNADEIRSYINQLPPIDESI